MLREKNRTSPSGSPAKGFDSEACFAVQATQSGQKCRKKCHVQAQREDKKDGLKYDQILPKNLHLKSLLLRNLRNHTGVCQGVPQGCIQPSCNYSFFSPTPKKKPRNTLNNQVFVDAWKSIGTKKTKSLPWKMGCEITISIHFKRVVLRFQGKH